MNRGFIVWPVCLAGLCTAGLIVWQSTRGLGTQGSIGQRFSDKHDEETAVGDRTSDAAEAKFAKLIDRLDSICVAAYDSVDVERYAPLVALLQAELNRSRANQPLFFLLVSVLERRLTDVAVPPAEKVLVSLLLGLNATPASLRQLEQQMIHGTPELRIASLVGLSMAQRFAAARTKAEDASHWMKLATYLRDQDIFNLPGMTVSYGENEQSAPPPRGSLRTSPELDEVARTIGRVPASALREHFARALRDWHVEDVWILVELTDCDSDLAVELVAQRARAESDVRLGNRCVDSLCRSKAPNAESTLVDLAATLESSNARANALHATISLHRDRDWVRNYVRERLMTDPEPDVAHVATQFLAIDADAVSIDAMRRAALGGSTEKRTAVLKAMQQVGRDVQIREKFNLCTALARDSEASVRLAALETAVALDRESARVLARSLLADSCPAVAAFAQAALSQAGDGN